MKLLAKYNMKTALLTLGVLIVIETITKKLKSNAANRNNAMGNSNSSNTNANNSN